MMIPLEYLYASVRPIIPFEPYSADMRHHRLVWIALPIQENQDFTELRFLEVDHCHAASNNPTTFSPIRSSNSRASAFNTSNSSFSASNCSRQSPSSASRSATPT